MKTDFFSEFFIVSDGSIICILFRSAPRAHPCSGHTFAYAAAGASAGASAGAAASPASAGAAATPASAGAAGAPASAGAATGGAGVLPGTSRVIIGSASAERPHWAAFTASLVAGSALAPSPPPASAFSPPAPVVSPPAATSPFPPVPAKRERHSKTRNTASRTSAASSTQAMTLMSRTPSSLTGEHVKRSPLTLLPTKSSALPDSQLTQFSVFSNRLRAPEGVPCVQWYSWVGSGSAAQMRHSSPYAPFVKYCGKIAAPVVTSASCSIHSMCPAPIPSCQISSIATHSSRCQHAA
mmetsp:Transcript_7995/g.19203  ORF Transcript_7995/g.19203 Transcript_7995/m.19203 type:complete len:296 (-) Transcript_7995:1434-2321(-)